MNIQHFLGFVHTILVLEVVPLVRPGVLRG
jgi:hypothetical protein